MCGGLAKGYVLAWDVAAGHPDPDPGQRWDWLREGGQPSVLAGSQALCDMEITLCNCTYVQFFL